MDFDTVITHGDGTGLAIVTYGNGVPTAKIAQSKLANRYGIESTVIDSPCLSMVPHMLKKILPSFDAVLFADVCKIGQHPQASMITALQTAGVLPQRWTSVGASPTYNPLGSLTTFLNVDDIVAAARRLEDK